MQSEIREKLLEMQDLKYKEFHSSLCPNVDHIIGVRIPVLRAYARELLKKYPVEQLLAESGLNIVYQADRLMAYHAICDER